MGAGLISKLALASVAAVSLYVPTMGLPLPLHLCLRTVGVANAAPSPTCGGDLRECLRASADLRQTTFGGRYVTADDVARCMESFNACINGSASRGGSQVPPTSNSSRGSLPQRFRMTFKTAVGDCRVNGESVSCTETMPPTGDMDSWDGQTTGSLSGLTLTGTKTARLTGHGAVDPSCRAVYDYSGPVTLVFSLDGKVNERWGPTTVDLKWSGSCPGSRTDTEPMMETSGTWSPSG